MATTIQTIIIDTAVNVGASISASKFTPSASATVYTVPAGKTFWGTLAITAQANASGSGASAAASASIGGVTAASVTSGTQERSFQIIGPGTVISISCSATQGSGSAGSSVLATMIGTLISNS